VTNTNPSGDFVTPSTRLQSALKRARRARVAVCICTSNRPEVIGQAVESVLAQSHRAEEIIVVDQSDGEATADVVKALRAGEHRLSYLHVNEKSLSRAYNTAAAHTTTPLLAFTDDDCVAPHGWLENIVRCFEEEPDVGLLYGQVLVPPELRAREAVEGVTPALPIRSRRRLSRRDGYRVFGMGANFAVRRALFEDLCGFDLVLGPGGPLQSAQDFDLSYRAFRRGHSILLAPEVVVHHYGFRSHRDWARVVRTYGIGMGGFYGKHVRLGDLYAARLLGGVLIRQILRAVKRSVFMHGAGIEWRLFAYTLVGLRRSLLFSIDREQMLYRLPSV
jgi:glycosyltransferase involved in cell wall biosynthesis